MDYKCGSKSISAVCLRALQSSSTVLGVLSKGLLTFL